ncbi:hypothetical protein BH11ACT5_BH11ACT5_06390 [soil metagenome]
MSILSGAPSPRWFRAVSAVAATVLVAVGMSLGPAAFADDSSPTQYQVTLDVNGGTNNESIALVQMVDSSTGFIPGTFFSRAGYGFAGWTTQSDGGGGFYFPGSKVVPSQDLTLYALWKANITVTFDLNGGTGSPPAPVVGVWSPERQSYSVSLPALPTTSRAGYQLYSNYWYADAAITVPYRAGLIYNVDASMTFYAGWQKVSSVVYNSNGGTFTGGSTGSNTTAFANSSAQCYVNTAGRGRTTDVTRTGYTLQGFNSAPDGSGATSCQWKGYYTVPATDVVLYAQWLATSSSTITYDANGGSGTVPTQSYTDGTAAAATVISDGGTLTRSGYVFTGWNTAASGSGTAYAASASIRPTADVTLYAQWVAVYTITYDPNGAQVTAPPSTHYLSGGTPVAAPDLSSYAPVSWTFLGWNTSTDGTGQSFGASADLAPTSDTILYAQWSIAEAAVSVDLPGGVGSSVFGGVASVDAQHLQVGSSWQMIAQSLPVVIGSGTVGATGTLAFSGLLPSGLEAGTHRVTFTSTGANGAPVTTVLFYQINAAGTVLRTTTSSAVAAAWPTLGQPASVATLAATGQAAPTGLLGQSALALMILGVTLLLAARRRLWAAEGLR